MKFGTQLGHVLRKIFGRRAIADLSCEKNGGHFTKWPPAVAILTTITKNTSNFGFANPINITQLA